MKRDYTNPKWDKVYEGLLKDPSELSFCFKYSVFRKTEYDVFSAKILQGKS